MNADKGAKMPPVTLPELPAGGIDDCKGQSTTFLRDYWLKKCKSLGRMPRFADIDLMDLYKIAPDMAIRDVIRGGLDFRNRYWGSGLTARLGFEGTNMLFSDYSLPRLRDRVLGRLRDVVRTGQPFVRRGRLELVPNREHIHFELLHLPLAAEADDSVAQIASVFDFRVRIDAQESYPSSVIALQRR